MVTCSERRSHKLGCFIQASIQSVVADGPSQAYDTTTREQATFETKVNTSPFLALICRRTAPQPILNPTAPAYRSHSRMASIRFCRFQSQHNSLGRALPEVNGAEDRHSQGIVTNISTRNYSRTRSPSRKPTVQSRDARSLCTTVDTDK